MRFNQIAFVVLMLAVSSAFSQGYHKQYSDHQQNQNYQRKAQGNGDNVIFLSNPGVSPTGSLAAGAAAPVNTDRKPRDLADTITKFSLDMTKVSRI